MGFFIPDTMKQINNWVVWRKEYNSIKRKYEKPPYNPITRRRISGNFEMQCCSYDTVSTYCENNSDSGMGFYFDGKCGLTFIDLDNCIDAEGNESALAEELQDLFKDCFIELSQSEKGLHIVCKGQIPCTIKTKEIEIYSTGQYMAMTGNMYNMNEPQEAQKRLDVLFDRFKQEKPKTEPQSKPQMRIYKDMEIDELIQFICDSSKQGAKFNCLHHGQWQDWKQPQYTSQSDADQAYFNIVNAFTNGNEEKAIEIFKQSNLYKTVRRKAKPDYYINLTLAKAKATATGSTKKKRTTTKTIELFEEPQKGRHRVTR